MIIIPANIVTYKHTALDDLPFKLVVKDRWFEDCNIHVVTNDAKYGDKNNQDATAATTSVITFRNINLNDLFFRNAGAAADTTIFFVGVEMLEGRMEELGVPEAA